MSTTLKPGDRVRGLDHGYVGVVKEVHPRCPQGAAWLMCQTIPIDPVHIETPWVTILHDTAGASVAPVGRVELLEAGPELPPPPQPLAALLADYDTWREDRADLSGLETEGDFPDADDWQESDDAGCDLASRLADALRTLVGELDKQADEWLALGRTLWREEPDDLDEIEDDAMGSIYSDAGSRLKAIIGKAETAAEPEPEAAWSHPEHAECADGCGIAVTHEGPCLDKPGGRIVCSHPQVCSECGENVELYDEDDPDSWIHSEGQPDDGHSAAVA